MDDQETLFIFFLESYPHHVRDDFFRNEGIEGGGRSSQPLQSRSFHPKEEVYEPQGNWKDEPPGVYL